MNEQLRGYEALERLPFSDTSLPFDRALELLTDRVQTAYRNNISHLMTTLQPQTAEEKLFIRKLQIEQAHPRYLTPGGYSFNEKELKLVYTKMGSAPHRTVLRYYYEDVFSGFLADQTETSRHPANICIGYLLDLSGIVNPAVADFDAATLAMIHVMRMSNSPAADPYLFGAMVDDAIHLRGTTKMPFELYIGVKDVQKLQNSYLAQVTPEEEAEFEQGFAAPNPKDMHSDV